METGDPYVEMQTRLARLELTLLEVVTALGMLVGELALRKDLALAKPEVVEKALEDGWNTLFGTRLERDLAPTARIRLTEDAPAALARAMLQTGAVVGAIYVVDETGERLELVASEGYPEDVMDAFASFPLSADLPAAEAVRTGRPLWFGAREEIIHAYPQLREAHEETEAAIGQDDVQGAAVPLTVQGRVAAALLVGFAPDDEDAAERLGRLRESWLDL